MTVNNPYYDVPLASRVSVQESSPLNAFAPGTGIKGDGSDETAALAAWLSGLGDGQPITWNGIIKTNPGVAEIGRISLIGQGPMATVIQLAGGDPTKDGITFGGSDGLRWFHRLTNFGVIGGAGVCRRAVVLLNLIDPTFDIYIKAGATDFGASIEGVQNVKEGAGSITVSNNGPGLLPGGVAPHGGVREVGSVLIPTNANHIDVNAEGLAGTGRYMDGSIGAVGSYNNYPRGVIQGNGFNLDARHVTDTDFSDLHLEGSGVGNELVSCQRCYFGRSFVDGNLNLITCDRITLDTTVTNVDISADSTNTHLGRRFLINTGATGFTTGLVNHAPSTTNEAWIFGESGLITPSIANLGDAQGGIGVTGARPGDRVLISYSQPVPQGVMIVGHVSANDVVSWIAYNRSGGTWNAAQGKMRADVLGRIPVV